jgi:hypothetical protein
MGEDNSDDAHERIWKKLFDEAEAILKDFAREGIISDSDYWLVNEDWGWDVVQIELPLSLAWPSIVKRLQLILARYPDWRVTVRLAGRPQGWPGMGIVISSDTIVDDLKRDYFPIVFRGMSFE